MILIFGGAYQGKLDFAKEKFNISDEEVFECTETGELDFSKRVIYSAELFFLKCVNENIEAADFLREKIDQLRDKIIIVCDISQGIVPMEPVHRAWREACGRAMMYLAGEADEVYKVFCGLGQRIK